MYFICIFVLNGSVYSILEQFPPSTLSYLKKIMLYQSAYLDFTTQLREQVGGAKLTVCTTHEIVIKQIIPLYMKKCTHRWQTFNKTRAEII